MLLSLAFTLLDILSVTNVFKKGLPAGIDPFWELAFVFKLLTDTMVLDDFKSALDRLHAIKMAQWGEMDGHQLTTVYSGAPSTSTALSESLLLTGRGPSGSGGGARTENSLRAAISSTRMA